MILFRPTNSFCFIVLVLPSNRIIYLKKLDFLPSKLEMKCEQGQKKHRSFSRHFLTLNCFIWHFYCFLNSCGCRSFWERFILIILSIRRYHISEEKKKKRYKILTKRSFWYGSHCFFSRFLLSLFHQRYRSHWIPRISNAMCTFFNRQPPMKWLTLTLEKGVILFFFTPNVHRMMIIVTKKKRKTCQ